MRLCSLSWVTATASISSEGLVLGASMAQLRHMALLMDCITIRLQLQGLGFLVLGGVPPEGFQVLNGFAARPLQANDTWRKRLPFNRCWQFGPWLSRAGTVTYPRCGGCQVSVGYRRAWCLAIAHLYSYAQMANFVRAGHRKRFCPS